MRNRVFLPLVVLLTVCAGVSAQAGRPPDLGAEALRYGRAALSEGDYTAAARHLRFALERLEDPTPALVLLAENARAAGDADAHALWVHDLYAWESDAKGRASLSSDARAVLLEDDSFPADLAQARAKAVEDLVRFASKRSKSKQSGSHLEVQWAEDFGRALATRAPALARAHASDFPPEITAKKNAWRAVVQELQRTIRVALSNADPHTAARAARVLKGLCAQASFDDLEGPLAPNLNRERTTADDGLARARRMIEESGDGFYSIEQLEEMDFDEQRALTLRHASFGLPAATRSPQEWYRVETSCGWETLHGAATTVELHHQRLANWYGEDPFVGRPGVLRVVPESHGLEAEGAGFWWVGGFQGGDTTTLKFTIGTIPGLGRGITHELTHRFDGALYGGLPAWLAEGKAVWTASAYGSMYDEGFVAKHCNFGTMLSTLNMGYGGQGKLEELVGGENEEYRDNYTAGYSLYVYLNTWPGGEGGGDQPIYAEPLRKFQEEKKRTRGDAVQAFASYFADGKDGRPDGMEAFAEEFREYLLGFRWREPAAWRDRLYTRRTPPGDEAATVLDEPTWTWLRHRAEPWFGQDQARIAGDLFAELARHDEAIEAYTWSLSVDEPAPATLAQLTDLLRHVRNARATWVVANWPRLRSPVDLPGRGEPCPFAKELPDVLELRELYGRASAAYRATGRGVAARAMRAEHDALSERLGLPALEPAADEALAPAESLHPFDPPPRLLGHAGWTEDGLTGHEDRRVEGLWFVDHAGDLHVGRRKARGGTDTLDRASHWRDAFVLSEEWQDAGRYRIRTQVEFTTSFVNAGVVFGYTRRDRNFRLALSGGDWDYATGEDEVRDALEGVNWSLDGLYARRARLRGGHPFGREKNFFQVEIHVDGPTVEVFLDDELVAAQSTLDGRPIVGRVGFYTSQGAVRVSAPSVQRLDRSAHAPGARATGGGLHSRRRASGSWKELVGRPVFDLPLHASGTVMLWFPEQPAATLAEQGADAWRERVDDSIGKLADAYALDEPSQGLTLVLPPGYPDEAFAALAEHGPSFPPGLHVVRHEHAVPLEDEPRAVQGWYAPLVLFVDPTGIVQFEAKHRRFRRRVPDGLRELMLQYLDHSRPGTAGASD